MPARSTQFQRLVAVMHACLSPAGTVQESASLPDKDTGEPREVDILIQASQSAYKVLIGIEVNEKGRAASVPWVESMLKKHDRLPTNKLVLISKAGFSRGALAKAAAHGAETLTLDQACDVDWPAALQHVKEGTFKLFTISWECSLHIAGQSEWYKPRLNQLIHLPTQAEPIAVGIIAQTLLNLPQTRSTIMDQVEATGQRDFHMMYTQDDMRVQKEDGEIVDVVRLCLGLKIEHSATPVESAIKTMNGYNFSVGQAIDPKQSFCFALKRNPDGQVHGMLYDNSGFRPLYNIDLKQDEKR